MSLKSGGVPWYDHGCCSSIRNDEHALMCPNIGKPVVPQFGAQFNLLDPLTDKDKNVDKPRKDDGKTYSEPVLPVGTECICDVTAFGLVVNEKCTYSHKS